MSSQSSDFGVVAYGDARIHGLPLDCLFGVQLRVTKTRGE